MLTALLVPSNLRSTVVARSPKVQTDGVLSAGEWKRAVLPILDDPAGWAFRGKMTYRLPVEWVLSGVLGEGSAAHRDHVYVWCVAMPLFVPVGHLTLSQSKRISSTKTFGLDDMDSLRSALSRAIGSVVSETGSLESWAGSDHGEVAAYSLVLLGRSEEASVAVSEAKQRYSHHQGLEWVQAAIERLDEVGSAIADGEGAAQRLLGEWRDDTAKALSIKLG